ncbi:MAG: c-type cytochrome, partial [Planctomyces sp.]
LRLRVALECESKNAKEHLLDQLKGDRSVDSLQSSLRISEDYGDQTFVSVQLQLAIHHKDDSVRSAALKALRRFVTPEVTSPLLGAYSSMSMPLQSMAREVLFRHPDSVLAFLELIDQKQIAVASVPLEELRALALFGNPEIDQLVRRHWGNLSPGTPEEKLADIRRFNNDLRAASGNAANGRLVFRKQCASCHRMDGEGIAIGPDISGTVRGDTQSLLTNLVDPGSFIRREYLTYVVVTQSGSVLSVLIAEQDAASLTLVDGKNQRTRISRDQIEEMTESTTSLMTEKILEPLSPQELRDLFAYLQGPHDSGSTPKP